MDMIGKILPRHLQIIFDINDYFLKTIQDYYPTTGICSRAFRLLMSQTAARCVWHGWRWWSATK